MPVLHPSICNSKACLSSLRYVWTKCKDKVSDVLISNQNIETSCMSKLKSTKLKHLCFRKTTVKDEYM